jgi:hypothetical protein
MRSFGGNEEFSNYDSRKRKISLPQKEKNREPPIFYILGNSA